MKDLEIGDTVEHVGDGRIGVVIALGRRWDGVGLALVEVYDPIGMRVVRREYAAAGLRKAAG